MEAFLAPPGPVYPVSLEHSCSRAVDVTNKAMRTPGRPWTSCEGGLAGLQNLAQYLGGFVVLADLG